MSRARDMANLGAQAGSGFDASDLTTGTLGNTVQDNITRLGIVTTGTMKNTIHSDATFPGPPTGASGGHVLQVVSQVYDNVESTTGSFYDTGLTASITPSNSSNKVLVLVSQAFGLSDSTASDSQQQVNLVITGGGTGNNDILHGQSGYDQFRVKNAIVHLWQTNLMYLHHPNTTSSFTYKTRMRVQSGSNTVVFAQYGDHPSTITLMEVVG